MAFVEAPGLDVRCNLGGLVSDMIMWRGRAVDPAAAQVGAADGGGHCRSRHHARQLLSALCAGAFQVRSDTPDQGTTPMPPGLYISLCKAIAGVSAS